MALKFSGKWLVLYPVVPDLVVVQDQLIGLLTEIGLAGDLLDNSGAYFATGKQFLSHICFLGCSPAIELEPQSDQVFCYVQVPESGQPLSVLSTGNAFKVRRKSVLSARTAVIIGNIYESEAVPESALLAGLEAATGSVWRYAYVSTADVVTATTAD
ncbi:MAG: hypothetical protein R3F02_17715 [Thiolinea sp.]